MGIPAAYDQLRCYGSRFVPPFSDAEWEQVVALSVRRFLRKGEALLKAPAISHDNDELSHASAAKSIAVTPTYQKFTISKAELGGFGWYRRLFIQGKGGAIFLDDVKLLYSTPATTSARSATVTATAAAALRAGLQVYPNPSAGEFHLELPSAAGQSVRATLYDGIGRVMLTRPRAGPAGSNSTTLDVCSAGLPQGTYLLRVETTDGQPLGSAPVLLR